MTIGQKIAEAGVEVEYALPQMHNWRFLPSATITVLEDEAKKFVYQCESFGEFHQRSCLPYAEASDIWEMAWRGYEQDEDRATGN